MAVGDVWRASIVGDWGAGNSGIITLHFQARTSVADLADVTAELVVLFTGEVITFQSNTWNWRQVNWYPENITPPTTVTHTTGFPLTGASAADSVGQQLAGILTLRTPFAGRSYRGRIYMPAWSEAFATGPGPTAGSLTNLQQLGNDLVTLYGTSGTDPDWRCGVWSRKRGEFNTLSSTLARTTWGVVRRRRAGVGS